MPLGAGQFYVLGMGDMVLRLQNDGYIGRRGGRFGTFPVLLPDGDYGDIIVSNDGTSLTINPTVDLNNNARVAVRKNGGADVGERRRLNLIEGSNITLTVTDDAGNEEVDVTIAASSSGSAAVAHAFSSGTLTAGYSLVVATYVEIPDGVEYEIGADADLGVM